MLTPTPAAELSLLQRQPSHFPHSRSTGLEALSPGSVPMNFGRNAEIYAEGERAGYVYKVVSGVVRISKLLPDGRRQISAFHLPGDMFGFEVDDLHHVSAEAIVPTRVIAFKWQSLLSSGASTGLVHELLNRTMIGLRQSQEHLLLLGRKNALERLAAFLLEMARRSGDETVIDLAMPRHDIADYLGLTLETVSRMFAELKEIGMIKLESARRVHLIDMAKLKAMAA
jgi:CRP/FNR family transcriptional regulator, nitrogen fixation regulation protein